MRFYLASTSPARLATLRAAGIEPVVMPSEVDERAVEAARAEQLGRDLTAAETVQLLADAKAEAVVASAGAEGIDGLVLGGDSVFELDGTIYGKPHTASEARRRWRLQRGRTGVLHSGHRLIRLETGRPVASAGAVARADVTFADDLDDAEVEAYIASGEPLKVAGAFTIDGLGGPFITRIAGDPSTVIGLSLPTLRSLAGRLGVAWPTLWNRAQL